MKAQELQKMLADRGVKQVFLAEKLGVSVQTINYWVQGKKPIPKKRIEPIKETLGI